MYLLKVLMVVVITQITTLLCFNSKQRVNYATNAAKNTFDTYIHAYSACETTSMPNDKFIADNLHSYINAFSKTTVGYAPQFTANRKFFANMISAPSFKKLLLKDINVLHSNILEKVKFCDESLANQDLLKQLYDREVDQTKL